MNDIIETERLLIRPVQPTDLDALHTAIFSKPELMEKGIYLGRALTYAESKSFVEGMCRPRTDARYISPSVFLLKETKELIGYGGLSSETNWGDVYRTTAERLDVEIFYVFKQAYWGRGLGTEMAQALVDYALHQRGADRIWAFIRATNKASQRVVEKAGMGLLGQVVHEGELLYHYAIPQ